MIVECNKCPIERNLTVENSWSYRTRKNFSGLTDREEFHQTLQIILYSDRSADIYWTGFSCIAALPYFRKTVSWSSSHRETSAHKRLRGGSYVHLLARRKIASRNFYFSGMKTSEKKKKELRRKTKKMLHVTSSTCDERIRGSLLQLVWCCMTTNIATGIRSKSCWWMFEDLLKESARNADDSNFLQLIIANSDSPPANKFLAM